MTIMTGVSVEVFLAGDWPVGSELVDGEVVVNDPGFRHQETVLRIVFALAGWCRRAPGRGQAGLGGNWVLAPGELYKPDVWWTADEHRPDPDSARSDTPPDLAMEVRSPGTWRLDIGHKRDVYAAAGVAELWLVDTPARTVIVLRRSAATGPAAPRGAFDDSAEFGPGDILTTSLLPDFALAIDDLFG
jgi:Uma2 family endonuclease